MAESLTPSEGVRLLLQREKSAGDEECAHYKAAVYTVAATFWYSAKLCMDGTAALVALEDAATPEDEDKLSKLAKSTARAAKRKLADALQPWPPRVLRWRGPGRG